MQRVWGKGWFWLVIILVIGAVFRTIWLDRVPNGIVNDELTYLLNAKSIAHYFTDTTHTWNPLTIFINNYPPGAFLPQAELPYFLFIPAVGWLPYSLISIRITNVLLGIGLILIMYFFSRSFFSQRTALLTSLVVALNPWLIAYSRTSYEAPLSLFFYFLGMTLVLRLKSWKILWSLPVFALAFYAYIGTKIILFPVVLVTCWVAWELGKRKYTKQYILVSFFAFILSVGYAGILHFSPHTTRIDELLTPNNPGVLEWLKKYRAITLAFPLMSLVLNKYTVFLDLIVQKIFLIFSFNYMFLYSDSFSALWYHGLFYYQEVILIILGFVSAWRVNKKIFAFLCLALFFGVIPQAIHSADKINFTPHIVFILPILCVFIALGIDAVISWSEQYKKQFIAIVALAAIYTISVAHFALIYFYQLPINNSYFSLPDRILSRYITLAKENHQRVVVYTSQAYFLMSSYQIYTNSDISPKDIQYVISNDWVRRPDVSFLPCPGGLNELERNATILIDTTLCTIPRDTPRLTIPQLSDSGEIFGIINDTLCLPSQTKRYVSGLTRDDFSIENMSARKLCSTFILRQH